MRSEIAACRSLPTAARQDGLRARPFAIAALLAAVVAGAAFAGEPLAPIDLVDHRAGACLEARGLAARWQEVRRSAWGARWERSKLYASWKESAPAVKLGASGDALEKVSGKPLEDLLRELFGRNLVFALYPQPEGDPAGILITEVESEAALDEAIALWSRLEKREIEPRRYLGIEYVRRAPPNRDDSGERPGEAIYSLRAGRILALSDREEPIRAAIALWRRHTAGEGSEAANGAAATNQAALTNQPAVDGEAPIPLSELAEYVAAQRTLRESCFVRVFVQPQEWLKQETARSEAAAASAEPMPDWVRGWLRCRSFTAGLRFAEGWIVEGTARFPDDASSERWARFVAGSAGPSPLLDRVPADALALWSGRVDLTDAGTLLRELVPEKDRRDFARGRNVLRGLLLGRDPLTDVLPALGPGSVGYVVAKPIEAPSRLPFAVLAAIRVNDRSNANVGAEDAPQGATPDGLPTPVHAALDNALSTGLNVLAALHNAEQSEEAVVRSERVAAAGEAKLRWIEGLGRIAPGYAALPEVLVVGTSPEPMRSFLAGPPARRLVEERWFRALAADALPGNQFVLVNVAAARDALEAQRAALVAQAARRGEMQAAEAERRLNDALDVLGLIDAAFLSAEFRPHEIRLTLGGVLVER